MNTRIQKLKIELAKERAAQLALSVVRQTLKTKNLELDCNRRTLVEPMLQASIYYAFDQGVLRTVQAASQILQELVAASPIEEHARALVLTRLTGHLDRLLAGVGQPLAPELH